MRLQVYLAHSGVASRRASERFIVSGRVELNGRRVTKLGVTVGPGDEVRLDGLPVKIEKRRRYLVLHKPPLYLCSSFDPQGRDLALDLLPRDIAERLYTVGRLDYRSSGLVFFTNDGDFAAAVSHPSREIEKEYLVEASGHIPDEVPEAFSRGVAIEGVRYQARSIERLGSRSMRVVLIEGKNREIRRVFSHFHLHPEKLHRVRIGPVCIGELGPGESRPLTKAEIQGLGKHDGSRIQHK
ncbi:MAG: rRNA pseudouridine synthase [Treponema sp.]|jgi:23S rRNA pseudouridine2605 synthase|nr:rRNA pseudouridine synthase [Treponema sp.]